MSTHRRRRLLTLFDAATTTTPTLPVTDGLGAWYKADAGIRYPALAANFNSAGVVYSFADTPSLKLNSGTGKWTIGCWVNIPNVSPTQVLFVKRNSPTVLEYQLHVGGGIAYATVYNGTAYTQAATPITAGVWHLLIATFDPAVGGGTLTIQIAPNAPVATGGAGTPLNTATEFRLGGEEAGTAFMVGRMQNAFAFGRVLSAAEVGFLYNGGAGRDYSELDAAFKTELRAWWKLGEASGSRLDSSTFGNTLLLAGTVPTGEGLTPTPTVGSSVHTWLDSGPNDLDVTQVTAANRPTFIAQAFNGKPALRFDGGDNLSRMVLGSLLAGTNAATVYIVLFDNNAGNNNAFMWADSPATNQLSAYLTYSGGRLWATGSPVTARVTASIPAGWRYSWHLTEMWRSGATGEVVTEGSSLESGGLADDLEQGVVAPLYIGTDAAVASLIGDIAELIFYNRALTPAERLSVHGYLMSKYGFAENRILDETAAGSYLLLEDGNLSGNGRLAMEA